MAAKTFKMTSEGKAELEKELDYLKTEGRIDIAEKLKVARSYGDLSENSEYDEAKSEQAKIEARISELEYQLDNVEIVDSVDKDAVSMGSKLKVKRISDGVELSFEIVGFAQSNPAFLTKALSVWLLWARSRAKKLLLKLLSAILIMRFCQSTNLLKQEV